MKYPLLLCALSFSQFIFSQELKTYKGSFDNFQDEFLGVRLSAENGAQAEFTFFLDANEQMVKQGKFLAEQSKDFTVSNQSFGYSGSASGRQYGRVTGSYKNNIKVGLWKYQKVQFGMNLSGAQFDFRKLEWNSLSINNSKEIESIRTVSVYYDNGIPEGEMKDEVFEKGKKIIDIKCSVHNGHFVGAFTGTSKDTYGTSRNGMFDQNGFYDGEWVDEDLHQGTITKWNFVHGVLISYVSHAISTGVKVKEYKNPIASYMINNELPKGIAIDTFEFTYPEKSIRFSNSGFKGKIAHENSKLPASELYNINYTPPPEISLGRDLSYNSTGAGSFLYISLEKKSRRLIFRNNNWNNYDSSLIALFSENRAEILKYGNSIYKDGDQNKDFLFTLLKQKGLYTGVESLFNNALNILKTAEGLYKGSENIEYINDFNNYYSQVNSTIEDIKPYTGIRKVITAYDKFQYDYLKKQKSNPDFIFLLNTFLDTSLANIETESLNTTYVTNYLIKLDSLTVAYNFPETTPAENIVLYFNNNLWEKLDEIFKGEKWKLIKDQVGNEIVKFTWYKYNEDEINYNKVNNDNPINNYYVGEYISGNILHYIKFLQGAKNYTLLKSGSIDSTKKYIEIKFKSKDSIEYNLYALFKWSENFEPYGELIQLTLMPIFKEDLKPKN